MTTLSVRLPESLHNQFRELAQREGISINQLIRTAAAEKMAALMTLDDLEVRGPRGSRERFDAASRALPAVEPEEKDRLD